MRPGPVVSLAAVVGLVLATPDPAGALSCRAAPDISPETLADGSAVGYDDEPFFDGSRFVVIGEIIEVTEAEEGGPPMWGPREIEVEVAAAVGRADVDPTITLRNEPTWGPRYEVGQQHLFITYATDESAPMGIGACLPGWPVAGAEALADELQPIADAAGTPFARPAGDTDPGSGWPWLTWGAGAVVLVLSAGSAILLIRRRSRVGGSSG